MDEAAVTTDENGRENVFSHSGNQHLGFHGRISQIGSRQTAHDRRQHDIHLSQSARQMTGDDFTKVHDALRDACIVHDDTGTDEERNRQQGDFSVPKIICWAKITELISGFMMK